MPSSPVSPTAPPSPNASASPASSLTVDPDAFVWHLGLHRIPDGLLLGVPGNSCGLATSRLLSLRGKAGRPSSRCCPSARIPAIRSDG